jgi:SPP1 gp7 family putative phage head morphogenesis protein
LEKFFYSAGTNIAFYNASRDPKYSAFQKKNEKAIYKQISPFFNAKNVKAVQDRVPAKLDKLEKFDSILEAVILALFVSYADLFGANELDEYLRWAGDIGGQASLDKAGIDLTFKLFNPEVVGKLRDRQILLINSVDNTTKSWIGRTIARGTEEGKSHHEIAKQIQKLGGDMSALRARKIVETETANAMGLVELESIKRNGSAYKKWITSRDERVCPICFGNESQGRIPIHEKFVSGVEHVPAHVFCRCYLEGSIPPDLEIDRIWTGA